MYWVTSIEGGPQRVNHAAASVGNKIFSFGGYNSEEKFDCNSNIDVHVFNTDDLKWRPVLYKNAVETPKKCYGHTVVAYGSNIYLWGGRNNLSFTNALYCFDTETLKWNKISVRGIVPKKVDGHSACVIGSYMYIFGGFENDTDKYSNAVHSFNFSTSTWEKLKTFGDPPSSRDFHTASVIKDRMYIFGGRGGIGEFNHQVEVYDNDIRYLDTNTMTWVKPTCDGDIPCGRRSHTAIVYKSQIYIIGGLDGYTKRHCNDIYKFNPETATWLKMDSIGEPPCPRRRHCSCIIGDQMYLFGGSSPFNEEDYATLYDLTDEDTENFIQLYDHSDLYILDFAPTLKRLSQLQIVKHMINTDCLPEILRRELQIFIMKDTRLKALYTKYPRRDFTGWGISA